MKTKVFIDENANLYTALYLKKRNVWVIWNAEENYLGFVPRKEASKLLKDLGSL